MSNSVQSAGCSEPTLVSCHDRLVALCFQSGPRVGPRVGGAHRFRPQADEAAAEAAAACLAKRSAKALAAFPAASNGFELPATLVRESPAAESAFLGLPEPLGSSRLMTGGPSGITSGGSGRDGQGLIGSSNSLAKSSPALALADGVHSARVLASRG